MARWKRSGTRRSSLHGTLGALCVVATLVAATLMGALVTPASAQTPRHPPTPTTAQPLAPRTPAPEHDTLDAMMRRGDYDAARKRALQHDDTASMLVRSRLATLDGKLDEAEKFAHSAVTRATSPAELADAEHAAARLERLRGRRDAAEARLRRVLASNPAAHAARYELADLLFERGQRHEAEQLLDRLTRAYNDGLLTASQDLVWLGRALMLLGLPNDANYAFERALRADPDNVEAHLAQGLLFMSKYNGADAEQAFDDALEINPNHPDVLVARARIEFEFDNQYDEAYALLERAERIARFHPDAAVQRARLAIYDADCARAREHLRTVLDHAPQHLEALTLAAACDLLGDDDRAFEARKNAVLAHSPAYTRFFTTVAHFVDRAFRYDDAVALYRRALAIDERDPDALVGLGMTLTHVGREDEALDVLREAFDADPFHVRAYNMLEFYEKALSDFVSTEHERFVLRAHKDQYDMIEHLVAPVVTEAMEVFDRTYGFRPDPFLSVELYPDATSFGARSLGVPRVSAEGLCFGQVVISRSPGEGNFNWRQVIWHEMAHVYHIQLSNNRVPRWFSEGLAEYETNIKDPAWNRYHDREISAAVFGGRLPGVLALDRGFTHSRSLHEVVVAYQLASYAVHYIADEWGYDALVAMLRSWGEKHRTQAVLERVLGTTPDDFDRGFERWLERRLSHLRHQLLAPLPVAEEPDALLAHARANPDDGLAWARLSLAYLQRGDTRRALGTADTAVARAGKNPEVRAIAAHVNFMSDRVRDAYDHGLAVLDAGRDGYDLRVLLGRAALIREDHLAATVHLTAATELYHDGIEAWGLLLRTLETSADPAAATLVSRARRRLFELDANGALTARRYATDALEAGNFALARHAAERWLDIQPFEPASHTTLARALLGQGDIKGAERAWEALLVLEPRRKAEIHLEVVARLVDAGHQDHARRWANRAREAGARPSRIERALQGTTPPR